MDHMLGSPRREVAGAEGSFAQPGGRPPLHPSARLPARLVQRVKPRCDVGRAAHRLRDAPQGAPQPQIRMHSPRHGSQPCDSASPSIRCIQGNNLEPCQPSRSTLGVSSSPAGGCKESNELAALHTFLMDSRLAAAGAFTTRLNVMETRYRVFLHYALGKSRSSGVAGPVLDDGAAAVGQEQRGAKERDSATPTRVRSASPQSTAWGTDSPPPRAPPPSLWGSVVPIDPASSLTPRAQSPLLQGAPRAAEAPAPPPRGDTPSVKRIVSPQTTYTTFTPGLSSASSSSPPSRVRHDAATRMRNDDPAEWRSASTRPDDPTARAAAAAGLGATARVSPAAARGPSDDSPMPAEYDPCPETMLQFTPGDDGEHNSRLRSRSRSPLPYRTYSVGAASVVDVEIVMADDDDTHAVDGGQCTCIQLESSLSTSFASNDTSPWEDQAHNDRSDASPLPPSADSQRGAVPAAATPISGGSPPIKSMGAVHGALGQHREGWSRSISTVSGKRSIPPDREDESPASTYCWRRCAGGRVVEPDPYSPTQRLSFSNSPASTPRANVDRAPRLSISLSSEPAHDSVVSSRTTSPDPNPPKAVNGSRMQVTVGSLLPQPRDLRQGRVLFAENTSSNVKSEHAEELAAFLTWSEHRASRRWRELQEAAAYSLHARVYLSAMRQAGPRNPTSPLTHDSKPPQFIKWIASEVDCFESFAGEEELRVLAEVAEGTAAAAIDAFISETIIDTILSGKSVVPPK